MKEKKGEKEKKRVKITDVGSRRSLIDSLHVLYPLFRWSSSQNFVGLMGALKSSGWDHVALLYFLGTEPILVVVSFSQ